MLKHDETKWFMDREDRILNALLLISGGAVIATINFVGFFNNEIVIKPQILKFTLLSGWFLSIITIVANIIYRFEFNFQSRELTCLERTKDSYSAMGDHDSTKKLEVRADSLKYEHAVLGIAFWVMFVSFFISLLLYVLTAFFVII